MPRRPGTFDGVPNAKYGVGVDMGPAYANRGVGVVKDMARRCCRQARGQGKPTREGASLQAPETVPKEVSDEPTRQDGATGRSGARNWACSRSHTSRPSTGSWRHTSRRNPSRRQRRPPRRVPEASAGPAKAGAEDGASRLSSRGRADRPEPGQAAVVRPTARGCPRAEGRCGSRGADEPAWEHHDRRRRACRDASTETRGASRSPDRVDRRVPVPAAESPATAENHPRSAQAQAAPPTEGSRREAESVPARLGTAASPRARRCEDRWEEASEAGRWLRPCTEGSSKK